jgi:ectonucleotide pyrophosphatase/phosphodiesterase family protein 5
MRKCLLAIFILLAWVPCLAAKPLVVLVSIDRFRPDYLRHGNSATLDELAESGASAKGLLPAFPSVTFPNHYSIVTGLVPDHHGIVNNTMFDPTVSGRPFSLAHRDALANPAWWNEGTPIWVTLHRQGKRSSTMFWPGSETAIHGVQPDDWLPYDDARTSLDRVEKLLSWLDRPDDMRADFATLYFSEVDILRPSLWSQRTRSRGSRKTRR